jgi:hypothetical protein
VLTISQSGFAANKRKPLATALSKRIPGIGVIVTGQAAKPMATDANREVVR